MALLPVVDSPGTSLLNSLRRYGYSCSIRVDLPDHLPAVAAKGSAFASWANLSSAVKSATGLRQEKKKTKPESYHDTFFLKVFPCHGIQPTNQPTSQPTN